MLRPRIRRRKTADLAVLRGLMAVVGSASPGLSPTDDSTRKAACRRASGRGPGSARGRLRWRNKLTVVGPDPSDVTELQQLREELVTPRQRGAADDRDRHPRLSAVVRRGHPIGIDLEDR